MKNDYPEPPPKIDPYSVFEAVLLAVTFAVFAVVVLVFGSLCGGPGRPPAIDEETVKLHIALDVL